MFDEALVEKLQKPHRLHPASMLFSFVRVIKETILGFGLGLIITLKESLFYFFIFLIIFVIGLIVYSIFSWLRFTYRVEGDELRIEQGVFIRKKRYISKHRIHKIDLTANVIHRLFKLVHVKIDTASNSGDAEVSLSAVRMSDAVALRTILQHHKSQEEAEREAKEKTKETISWKRLFIAGSTSGSAGVIILAVLTVFSQIEELIPRDLYDTAFHYIINLSLVLIVIISVFALVVLWLFGIAGTMIKYGNFTIEKREKGLFIKRGLLETKELTIPYQRIQAVGIEQSPIRQPFGYVRVFAVVAGGSFDDQETYPVLFPLLHEREVISFITTYLPEFQGNVQRELKRIPKVGRLFYVIKNVIFPILILIPCLIFFPQFSWIPLILVLLSGILGWLQHQDAGYDLNGRFFNFQFRRIQKVYVMTTKNRIQAFEKTQHVIQRKLCLASLNISLLGMSGIGTHYALHHLDETEVNEIGAWYSHRKTVKEPDVVTQAYHYE